VGLDRGVEALDISHVVGFFFSALHGKDMWRQYFSLEAKRLPTD
jgi:hypothetical protein